MDIQRIEDSRQLAGLRAEWEALLVASPADGLFLTWEWLATWWQHLSAGRRLHVLALRSEGELVAIAPFILRRWRAPEVPFPVLEFLGAGSAGSDYLDLIIRQGAEPESLNALADHLNRVRLPMRLSHTSVASAAAVALAARLHGRGWHHTVAETDVCPVVRWPAPSWASYLATWPSKDRVDFRRRLNNLSKQFDVRFEQVRTEDERRTALATLFELHGARWRHRGRSTAFHTPALRAFHEEFSRIALERGWLRLFVLWLDGRPASVLYGFRYGRTFYDYQKGFDPAYSRHAVGLITTGLAIKSAMDEGAAEYDFLRGGESYKFRWARDLRRLGRVELFNPGVRGAVYRWLVTGGAGARRAARRLLGDALAERLAGQRG